MNRSWSEETLVLADSTSDQNLEDYDSDSQGPADSTSVDDGPERQPQEPMSRRDMAEYIAQFWPDDVEAAAERVLRRAGIENPQKFVEDVLKMRNRRHPNQFPDQSHWSTPEAEEQPHQAERARNA